MNMLCKRLLLALLAILTALTATAGPKQKNALQHIKFGKCRIVSLVPTGLRSVRAGVEFETRNDTSAFVLEDVKLTIFKKGEPFVEGVCNEVSVPKGTSKVRVTGEFELCDGVSVWSAVTALRDPDLSEYSGNVDLTVVGDKGRKVAYSQKDVSLGSFGGQKPGKKADAQVASADGAAKSGQGKVSSPDKSSTPKAEQPKQTKNTKKRPWWQFWKK